MGKQIVAGLLSCGLLLASWPENLSAYQDAPSPAQNAQGAPYQQQTPEQLQQLVAPIALYPDSLVAQILAASAFPEQVVEADRFVQSRPDLKGDDLGQAVDQQPWDPSVKALAPFPSVLGNMDKNLSWTSSLGDAYFNDPQSVISAIQVLRKDASNAGTLKTTSEQTVTTEGQTIIIQPANPEVVYVPEYSPAVVYGTALEPYPGYSGWDVAAASALTFGAGMFVGAAVGGWGWGHWGMDWHGGSVNFNRNAYVSRSNTFANRSSRYGQANRGNYAGRNTMSRSGNPSGNRAAGMGSATRGQAGQAFSNRERQNATASRGFGQAGQGSRGTSSSAFGNVRQGGSVRIDSARGSSSFRGGGGGRMGGGRRR
jgi:hypothetical protein